MQMLQNNKTLFVILTTALVATASAAYFNIGSQYTLNNAEPIYYISIDNNIYNFNLSLKFFNDKISAAIFTPFIWFGNFELGYDISRMDFDTLYKGNPYFGISESIVFKPIRLRVDAVIDSEMKIALNGEIGIGF